MQQSTNGDVKRLTDYAAGISAEMEERGARLRVIIVDTLAAAAPSADENVSRDMGPVMLSFQRMAAELGCVVILVAHTGKDVARGLRGWSGIRANVDFAIECRVDKDKDTGEINGRQLWFEKSKDGPDGFILAEYHLKTTFLGPKASGEQDTTCWVDYSDPPKAPRESEIRAAQETRKEAQAEALRVQEKEQAEALRDQILGALTEYLTDQWRPLRETAEVIKHKGLVSLGVNPLQGYLTSLADVSEGVTEIPFKGTKIEIETTPKGGRFFRRFRVVKDD